MITVKVYQNSVLKLEHEISNLSMNNGYVSCFLTGGLIALPFSVGEYVQVQAYNDEEKVMDIIATFESYQFSMSSYVSNGSDGLEGTQTGVTNNSLVFKILQMNSAS